MDYRQACALFKMECDTAGNDAHSSFVLPSAAQPCRQLKNSSSITEGNFVPTRSSLALPLYLSSDYDAGLV
jgi:hypothetical protein